MNKYIMKEMKTVIKGKNKYHKYTCFIIIIIIFISSCSLEKKDQSYNNFDSEVNIENLIQTVNELSSEKYQGRLTGTDGNRMAMEYVINEFESYGLDYVEKIGDYIQDYSQFVNFNEAEMIMEIVDKEGNIITQFVPYENYREALFYPECDNNDEGIVELYYVTELDQLKENRENVEGKFVVIHNSLITDSNMHTLMQYADSAGAAGIAYERDNKYNDQYYVKSRSIPYDVAINGFDTENGIVSFYIDHAAADSLLDAYNSKQLVHYDLNFNMLEVETGNVISYIKGETGNETIVVGAHLDHVGSNNKGEFWPGALDNASGIATMLEVSRIVSESKVTPKMNIVFIAFNGEEVGLMGSRYYVSQPVYDLETTTMINLDMVGSKREVPLSIESINKDSDELKKDFEDIAKKNDVEYDLGSGGISDHLNFAEKGAQAIMLINYDMTDIHTPRDTVERNIDEDYMGDIANLILQYLDKNAY